MQYPRSIWCLLFMALAVSAFSAPAHAQNSVSWVSATGNDANTCGLADPCARFSGALPKTIINGEIRCLDAGNFLGVAINKSITIDCHDVSVVVTNTPCFYIALSTSVASDPAQTVKIRGVTCDGFGIAGNPGVQILSAAAVFLEDMVITDNALQGVIDTRTHGGVLFIKNSVIRNSGGPGIVAATTGGPYGASIDNVHSVRNAFGIAVARGNNVMVTKSVLSGNSIAGLELDSGAQVTLDNSLVNFNTNGVLSSGFLTLTGSTISYNSTGISGASNSFGDNKIYGNSSPGTAPTVGAASTDHSKQ